MKPRIFIGSSGEGRSIAEIIQANFTHDAYPTVWHQMVFTISSYPLDSLLRALGGHDFAVLVLSPDDVSTIRGVTASVPRTNVLFEAALFIGRLGRDRCFLVQPRSQPAFALPTDLLGLIPATYDEKHYERNPAAALGTACTDIRNGIKMSPSFNRSVTIISTLQLADPATSNLTYPKKLSFQVQNQTASAVVVTSHHFDLQPALKGDLSRRAVGMSQFRVEFLAYRNHAGQDVYQAEYLLKPGASVRAWLALDRATDDSIVREALEKRNIGTWRVSCHWLAEPMENRECEFEF